MMPLWTTEDDVANVVEIETTDDIAPFIYTASELIDRVLAASTYTDETKKSIGTWLTAHFYRVFRPVTQSESLAGLSESFAVNIGQQLKQTTYGQQVLILDTEGWFVKLQANAEQGRQPRKISLMHLG